MKPFIRILLLLCLFFSATGVRAGDTTRFVRPPYLCAGDTVGIVAPSGKLPLKTDTAKIRARFASWGLHVRFGAHCADRSRPYFAGTDAERAADLQRMLDDPSVKAVIACRGGYGAVRLLPLLDLARLRERPKWFVGFSDATMLHLALRTQGLESIHGPMPASFRFDEEDPSAETLRAALFGELERIDVLPHPLNRCGRATGRLAGGNLSLLCATIGTPEGLRIDEPTVLFIEEVGEFAYRIDRMMQQLLRSGRLSQISALVVGHFTETMGVDKFGAETICEVIDAYAAPLGIPVAYGFPAGHEEPNLSLYLGREVEVEVDEQGASIRF